MRENEEKKKKKTQSTELQLFALHSKQNKLNLHTKNKITICKLKKSNRKKNNTIELIDHIYLFRFSHHIKRMVRSEKSQSNNGKKPTKSSDCENEYMTTSESDSPTSETRDSVHKQNLFIVSFPIIILFNILRSILYHIFIIFKYIFNVSSNYMPIVKRQTNPNRIEIDVNNSEQVQPLNSQVNSDGGGMASSRSAGPGPGDPLLAKQKHHHRRAFEYISKALKIDEENEGKKTTVQIS